MSARHILSIADLSSENIATIVQRSCALASCRDGRHTPLAGRSVGLYFRKTSTRTRTSFAIGAGRLGATVIIYGPSDLQTNTGETVGDTAKVLAGYLDALVVRTAASIDEMKTLAAQDEMS